MSRPRRTTAASRKRKAVNEGANKLLWRKVIAGSFIGFIVTFLPLLVPIYENLDDLARGEVEPSFVLSLLMAAVGAGLGGASRFALAYFTNFVPGDEVHGRASRKKIPPAKTRRTAAARELAAATKEDN